MLVLIISVWAILYFAPQAFALGLLIHFRSKARKKSLAPERNEPGSLPGVSVMTSMKGPTPHMAEGLRSFLLQRYPGPVELIIATIDEKEPLLSEARKVVAETPSAVRVRFIQTGEIAGGLNPRTAKIARAYDIATHGWVLITCVDTRFAPGFLRRAMQDHDENQFVTSFPVIDSPGDFSARLEAVGLNVEVSQFFLFASLAKSIPAAYGGGLLFHRSLLKKAGGWGPILPLLTDDITLARAFLKAGGRSRLPADLGYVRQHEHSMREFWTRQVRWRMIAKYFMPELFYLSPMQWFLPFLAVVTVFDSNYIHGLIAALAARVCLAVLVQMSLGLGARDWAIAWVAPFYDAIAIFATLKAFFASGIRWGSNWMDLNRAGAVTDLKVTELT